MIQLLHCHIIIVAEPPNDKKKNLFLQRIWLESSQEYMYRYFLPSLFLFLRRVALNRTAVNAYNKRPLLRQKFTILTCWGGPTTLALAAPSYGFDPAWKYSSGSNAFNRILQQGNQYWIGATYGIAERD